jgi:hypothetical protein
MRKAIFRSLVPLFTLLLSLSLFADYMVVMKDGTRYKAKQKWTMVNGKALIQLKNGQTMQVDPNLIDVPKSERMTKLGVDANLIDLNTANTQAAQPAPQQPSLGSQIRLRPRTNNGTPAAAPSQPATSPGSVAPISTGGGSLPTRVIENFDRAYENVGIFEKKLDSTGARSLRAELTVDTEERVFNAISATSFLMVKNAGVDGAQIDMVELFMKTTNGGSAGRFQMSRADADALEARTISQHDYFVRKVIY